MVIFFEILISACLNLIENVKADEFREVWLETNEFFQMTFGFSVWISQ